MSEAVQLPVLDLSGPIEPSSLDSLSRACQEWGFFYVTNHGISTALFSKACSLLDHVFSLPPDSKLKLGPLSSLKTYTPRFLTSPYYESLRVAGPDFLASAKASAAELFGHQNTEFEEIMQECGSKMMELAKRILDAVLMSLGDGKLYESEFDKCNGYLRAVKYSPEDEDEEGEEVEGLEMHTDLTCVTILYQDEVGGLQVRSKDGVWTDIPPREGSLVVNVGDLLQAWSNGRLRSSQHRVVMRTSVNRRQSIAFFWIFEEEKVVAAPEEVVGEGNPRIYKPFLCSDYLNFRRSHGNVSRTVYDFAGQ